MNKRNDLNFQYKAMLFGRKSTMRKPRKIIYR